MEKTNFKTFLTEAAQKELAAVEKEAEETPWSCFKLEIRKAREKVELATRVGEFLDGCDSVSEPKPVVKTYRDGTKGTSFQSEWKKGRSSGYMSWGSCLEWESRNKSSFQDDTDPTGWWWGDGGMVGGGVAKMSHSIENTIPMALDSFLHGRYSKR